MNRFVLSFCFYVFFCIEKYKLKSLWCRILSEQYLLFIWARERLVKIVFVKHMYIIKHIHTHKRHASAVDVDESLWASSVAFRGTMAQSVNEHGR